MDRDRCAPWCRHYFRVGEDAFCDYGNDKMMTQKGASCMGKREVTSKKSEEDRKKEWLKQLEKRKMNALDKRCRTNCAYFSDNCCTYGPDPVYTEDGAFCIGKKKLVKKKRTAFEEVKE